MIKFRNVSIIILIYRCSRELPFRRLSVLLAVAATIGPDLIPCRAGWREDIGFTLLQSRLGPAMPTGDGIRVAQIETSVGIGVNYLPDSADPQFVDKSINALSSGTGVSSHATTVGEYFFGLNTSVGPGIRIVDAYEANNWCAQGFLNFNSALPPVLETARIANHSWVSSFGLDLLDNDVLRRMDLVVQRDGVLVAAGVGNGAATPMPRLMCSGYNTLAVGLSNGQSSSGPTLFGPAGRVKPDLVVPLTAASWATPVVASCGALLIQTIQTGAYLNNLPAQQALSAEPLLTKALLMGGASKAAWPDWRRGFAAPSTNGTVPLDYRYGAGQLNIDNSHRILTAGEFLQRCRQDWLGLRQCGPGRTPAVLLLDPDVLARGQRFDFGHVAPPDHRRLRSPHSTDSIACEHRPASQRGRRLYHRRASGSKRFHYRQPRAHLPAFAGSRPVRP
jgi:hypothetical protein